MEKTKNILLVVLILLVVGSFGYIGYDKYLEMSQEKEALVFEQGAQFGYTQAVTQVVRNAATCQQVPLTVDNQTINLIAVECLEQAAALAA